MGREKVWLSDAVARVLSIWSIAGMTVARFGVPREKNSIASLNIWRLFSGQESNDMGETDTFKTSLSSWAIPHSAGDSSYLHRSKSHMVVILSIAGWKSSAKRSMS